MQCTDLLFYLQCYAGMGDGKGMKEGEERPQAELESVGALVGRGLEEVESSL